jgi:hypothetical protein
MTDHKLIEDRINQVLLNLQESNAVEFDSDLIADRVDALIDPERLAPALVRYAARRTLKDMAGRVLAHRLDPVTKTKQHITQETGDLFSGVLQDHYPVKRQVDGEPKKIYIRRDDLTETDIERIAQRMDRAGDSLNLHAQALKAYFKTREASRSVAS